jgi:hypothetical protein
MPHFLVIRAVARLHDEALGGGAHVQPRADLSVGRFVRITER